MEQVEVLSPKITRTTNEKYGMPIACRVSLDAAWDIAQEAKVLGESTSRFGSMLLMRGWDTWKNRLEREKKGVDLDTDNSQLEKLVLDTWEKVDAIMARRENNPTAAREIEFYISRMAVERAFRDVVGQLEGCVFASQVLEDYMLKMFSVRTSI